MSRSVGEEAAMPKMYRIVPGGGSVTIDYVDEDDAGKVKKVLAKSVGNTFKDQDAALKEIAEMRAAKVRDQDGKVIPG
jgi:hypothetical protein